MSLHEEINELLNLVNNHTEEIAHLKFFIKMKNGTVFKYKMDKRKEFKHQLKEELAKLKNDSKLKHNK